jgi:hypothetical protein
MKDNLVTDSCHFVTSRDNPYKETKFHGPNFTEPPPDLVQGQEEWEVDNKAIGKEKDPTVLGQVERLLRSSQLLGTKGEPRQRRPIGQELSR